MMVSRPPPKITVVKHEQYRDIIQSGAFGGHRPGFFEWIVYTDEMIAEDALSTIPPDPSKMQIKRTLQCRLILTPMEAKNLVQWLTTHISQYERNFGKIPAPQEVTRMAKERRGPSTSPYV